MKLKLLLDVKLKFFSSNLMSTRLNSKKETFSRSYYILEICFMGNRNLKLEEINNSSKVHNNPNHLPLQILNNNSILKQHNNHSNLWIRDNNHNHNRCNSNKTHMVPIPINNKPNKINNKIITNNLWGRVKCKTTIILLCTIIKVLLLLIIPMPIINLEVIISILMLNNSNNLVVQILKSMDLVVVKIPQIL